MTDNLEHYTGSRLLVGLSSYTSLNLDLLNFMVSQAFALGLAGLYRTVLGPARVSPNVRHAFGLLFGLWMGYFCFGYQALHLAVLPAICYLVILTQNPTIVHGSVLFTAMLYLSLVHVQRQFFKEIHYGLDISGPLMIIVQKVTSLAFSLHDGLVSTTEDHDNMTETQKYYAVKRLPSVLEFFSYCLMFPSLMAGPFIFYQDYMDFIEGHSVAHGPSLNATVSSNQVVVRDPSPARAIVKKIIVVLACGVAFFLFLPRFPIARLKEEQFIEHTTLSYKFWYLSVATSLVRTKYYFAWTLSDAICNNAGLGWDGGTSWSKFSNIDIFRFEFGTSLKESIDAWNKGTNQWLRFIVYKRATTYSTFLTFALSAIWHGFYPGYYLTFFSGALFTFASRTMRRCLRNYFTSSSESKFLYDIVTFAVTRFVMAYVTFSFVLLEFWSSVVVYNKLYWVLHLAALLAIAVVPRLIPKAGPGEMTEKNGIARALRKAGPYSDAVGKID